MGHETAVVSLESHLPAVLTEHTSSGKAVVLFCFSLELPRNCSGIGHWLPTVSNIFHSKSSLDLELELELREERVGTGMCPGYMWFHGSGSSGLGNLWFLSFQLVSQWLSVWTSSLFPHSNLISLFLFCRGLREKMFWSKKGQDSWVHYQTDKSLLCETVGGFSAQVHILSLLHLSMWLQCNWEGDYLKPLPETEYLFLLEFPGVILFVLGLYLKQEKQVIPWTLQVSKLSVVYCTEQWLL